MKRLILLAVLTLSSTGAFAQGTILFENTANSLVYWNGFLGGGASFGATPVDASFGIKVGLYYGSGGTFTLVSTQFPIVGTSSAGVADAALNGRFTGNPGVLTIPGLAGGQIGTFQVRAWSGNFTSYEAAFSGGALDVARSVSFENPSGNVLDPVRNPPAPLTGFSGIGVPEPSVYVLAGFGFGALVLLRRSRS